MTASPVRAVIINFGSVRNWQERSALFDAFGFAPFVQENSSTPREGLVQFDAGGDPIDAKMPERVPQLAPSNKNADVIEKADGNWPQYSLVCGACFRRVSHTNLAF